MSRRSIAEGCGTWRDALPAVMAYREALAADPERADFLHVVLSDGNFADRFAVYAVDDAWLAADPLAKAAAEAVAALTVTQRRKLARALPW